MVSPGNRGSEQWRVVDPCWALNGSARHVWGFSGCPFLLARVTKPLRPFVLVGAMYGAAHGIAFDDELYYVSALLHDIGLTDAFDSHRVPFEEAGGDLVS